jgi:electron transfer flavoprotein alpha subunit
MSFVWTIAEQHGGNLKSVSFELLARGRALADKLGTKLASVLIGHGVDEASLQELIYRGADEVYSIQDPRLEHFVCESYARVLTGIINIYRPPIIIAAATSSGRTLMPYVAVQVGAGLTADCTELDIEAGTGNLLQTRPAIGGNIMATIKTPDHRPQMATVRPKSARPLPRDPDRLGKVISVTVGDAMIDDRVRVLGYRKDAADFVNLEEAEIVVAGGKGLKKGENFVLLRELAEAFGHADDGADGDAMVGASREAVDRGWIGYPHQIGLSGKTISPKLYIGAGISGSIQHLAGIKTSEIIVSINPDPDASLHKVADFAIVGDAFQVLPALRRRLETRKKEAK